MKYLAITLFLTCVLQVTFSASYGSSDEEIDSRDFSYDNNEEFTHRKGDGKMDYGEGIVNEDDYVGEDQGDKPQYKLSDAPALFEKFINDYEKKYTSDVERQNRYKNFIDNLEVINRLNSNSKSATFDINMFSDLTKGEFSAYAG